MEAKLIKKPHQVSFTGTGNPVAFTFAITPYGANERNFDVQLNVRLQIEINPYSNNFADADQQSFIPNERGIIEFDASSIIDAFVDWQIQPHTVNSPIVRPNQATRYRLVYTLIKDNAIEQVTTTSNIFNAVKGGLDYINWHPSLFFTDVVATQKKPLLYDTEKKIFLSDPLYFSWLYPFADQEPMDVIVTLFLNTGADIIYSIPGHLSANQWQVCSVAINWEFINQDADIPDGVYVTRYEVKVTCIQNDVEIVAPVTFTPDYRNFYYPHTLIYANGIGGFHTMRTRGQSDYESDYTNNTVRRTSPPSWYTENIMLAQDVITGMQESPRIKADTGFITQQTADTLRALFLSGQVYELYSGKLVPVTLSAKNVKFYSRSDNLVSLQIEWLRPVSYQYTPAQLISIPAECPAMDHFSAVQVNRTLLQLTYAMATPYDLVEVEIEIDANTYTFRYRGNTGNIRQMFLNPATTIPVDITVRTRTICNEFSDPVSAGPWSTIVLSVIGNSLPVANDDNYYIAIGFNSSITLPGSVLLNDFDPDGDPLEVIAVFSGTTHATGTYSINAAGVITYQPPSSAYAGQDYFDYQCREVGGVTTVTARAYINVGVTGGAIYAKIVYRNLQQSVSGYQTVTTAEVWIDFFSNAAATQPIDVSSFSLTINYDEITEIKDPFGLNTNTDNLTVPGAGTKVKIFEGTTFNSVTDSGTGEESYTKIIHAVTAGTGYIAI